MKLIVALLATAIVTPVAGQTRTQVVLLGTGTPRPEPERSGPATAIVVNGTAYLVDHRARHRPARARPRPRRASRRSRPKSCETAFVTHLHSDHTVGYPDLIFDVGQGRRGALKVYGPEGLEQMTTHHGGVEGRHRHPRQRYEQRSTDAG